MSVTKVKLPEGYENFSKFYSNTTLHSRTVFLDLDDTLIYLSLYPIGSREQQAPLISFSEGESIIKVNI